MDGQKIIETWSKHEPAPAKKPTLVSSTELLRKYTEHGGQLIEKLHEEIFDGDANTKKISFTVFLPARIYNTNQIDEDLERLSN